MRSRRNGDGGSATRGVRFQPLKVHNVNTMIVSFASSLMLIAAEASARNLPLRKALSIVLIRTSNVYV